MDWLDLNKKERNTLFSSRKDNANVNPLTKKVCGTRAAVAIFSCDANPALRRRVEEDPVYFGKLVMDHIRNQLSGALAQID